MKPIILKEKTGTEYYNMASINSLNETIFDTDGKTEFGDYIGKHDSEARMTRLKQYILSIPQYKKLERQREVIELLIDGYNVTDIGKQLGVTKTLVSNCIINFRKYAKKYLTNLKEGGIL